MTDKDFLKLIRQVKSELHKRYGTKMCKELEYECADCAVRILIAGLNKQINLLEWCLNKKRK